MDTFNDKTLACVDCGQDFVFSKNEQAFYAERGFTNEPKPRISMRSSRMRASTIESKIVFTTVSALTRVMPAFSAIKLIRSALVMRAPLST